MNGDSKQIFTAGDVIYGKLHLNLRSSETLKSIQVKLEGKVVVIFFSFGSQSNIYIYMLLFFF